MPNYERLPRRILMTTDTIGGVWNYALELALGLHDYNIEIVLATMGAELSRPQRQEASRVKNLVLYESKFKLEWMTDPWEEVKQAGDWLLELEQAVQPDLVHLNGYVHGVLNWQTPTMVVGHSCCLSWWEAVKGQAPQKQWDYYRTQVGEGIRKASLVVAPSETMLKALQRLYGPLKESFVIPNGRKGNSTNSQTEKLPQILSVGRLWDEAKNIAALQRVAPELSWPIYLAGERHHPEGDRITFSQLRFLGKLSESQLASWYDTTAIYALPALYEPFGLSILEAGLAGCALVLGDIPSMREIWNDAALFVPSGDDKALKEAINGLIRDASVRKKLGRLAQERGQEYSPDRMVRGYLAAYERLLYSREYDRLTI